MLKVTDLCVEYGTTRVVDGLGFELGADEILTLVGPTGCGKTTVLQALAGLLPIAAGEVSLGDWTATASRPVPPEKRRVGMVFQDFALFPHLSVEQNVSFKLADSRPADHWISVMGLGALRDAKPGSLSGGQRQRVALARALAHAPDLMLLDEPLSNLDAALKDNLRWEIRDALKTAGVPALWVTHDQDEALSMGDRLGVMHQGVLQQLASPGKCFSEPASRFVARFLGEASFIPGRLQGREVQTEMGGVPATPIDTTSGDVDLLLRPDDLSLHGPEGGSNGVVQWVRYEGGTRLYAVQLDSGVDVRIRVCHETAIAPGARVQVAVTTTHPLAAFRREKAPGAGDASAANRDADAATAAVARQRVA